MKRKILLLFLSIVISFFLGEVILRVANLPKELDYKYKKISIQDWMQKHNTHNRVGYRDTEHLLEKQENTYRIFFIGDSFTYGLFIDNTHDTFPVLIGKGLQKKTTKQMETINAGFPGFDIFKEVNTFTTEGKKYHPDLVVLALNFDEANVKHVSLQDPNDHIPLWIKVSRWYQIGIGSHLRFKAEKSYRNYMLSIYTNKNSPEWKTFEKQLVKLQKEAQSINANVAIILFPPIYPRQPNKAYDFHVFNTTMKEMGKKHGIIIIDPLQEVLAYKKKEDLVISPLDAHPTVQMNKIVANTFLRQFPLSLLRE